MAKISIIPWIVKKLKRCIGIVEDTDTASQAIASNKYVIWKGDVCKSTSAISEGDTLSSSNLSTVTGGIGNDLAGAVNTNTQAIAGVSALVNSKSETLTLNTKIASYNTRVLFKSADVFSVGLDITVGATAIPAWEAIATASTLVPSSTRQAVCTVNNVTGASMVACGYLQFSSAGNISLPVTLSANTRYNIRAVGI